MSLDANKKEVTRGDMRWKHDDRESYMESFHEKDTYQKEILKRMQTRWSQVLKKSGVHEAGASGVERKGVQKKRRS